MDLLLSSLADPAAANHNIAVIEHSSLPGSDGALGLVKGHQDFVVASLLNDSRSGLMSMANLHGHAHWLANLCHGNQVHSARAQCARVEMLVTTDDHLLIRTADLDDVQRRSGRDAKSLALAHSEVVNARVLADDFAVRGDEFARSVGQRLALLGQIRVDEPLVVAAGNKADLL